ncbi:hypothetical protein [Hyphococcus lacteus]|uniref:Uncharacterized protein n=1 Tax=Hyphococcus lacteus TaxID=3143536 RepID=A0ABV3Z9I1_9PROT
MPSKIKYRRSYKLDDYIVSGITARELLRFFRRMDGWHTFFGEFEIPNFRTVFGGATQLQRLGDPASGAGVIIKEYTCATGSGPNLKAIWRLKVTFTCSMRSFEHVEYADENYPELINERFDFRETWHDEDITSIELRSAESQTAFEKEVLSFISEFRVREGKIADPSDWEEGGLIAKVRCRCGHTVTTTAPKLSRGKRCSDIFALKNILRCSACGNMGEAEILPWFLENTVTHIDSSRRYFDGDRGVDRQSIQQDVSFDLYGVMDGDGESDVYLGDGVSIKPDGRLSED